jgi:hypothetical protein
MLLVHIACRARRPASHLPRPSPPLYHLLLLPAIPSSALGGCQTPFSSVRGLNKLCHEGIGSQCILRLVLLRKSEHGYSMGARPSFQGL